LRRGRSRRPGGAARRVPGRVRKAVRQGPGDAAGHLPQDRPGCGEAMSAQAFNDWSASVTALAVAILWQSALLAGLTAGVCWLLRRSAPALRYWCWQIVALKLLLMPWWVVALPLPGFLDAGAAGVSPPAARATEDRGGTPGAAADRPVAPPDGGAALAASETPGWSDWLGRLTWRSWLVLAWLGGIAWQVGCLLVRRG